ncbi:beta-1,4-galactosyltransferase 7-like [Mytilus trossulus]|uniref:beta-1,4-galactosyltransferase 7-like n=1 Tax=Mytilus trossulus TaxID=6551 RepID=UPI003007A592
MARGWLVLRSTRFLVLGLCLCSIIIIYISSCSLQDGQTITQKESNISCQKDHDNKSWGRHKLAILVPFRDRLEELLEFAPYIHRYLNHQKIRHDIYVINQIDEYRFNRASLINVGFLESNTNCDYIAMHDVDLVPVTDGLPYTYPVEGPVHVASPELHPIYHYKKFVGGILLFNRFHFIKINGMSNRYWGWGREDDELYVRIKKAGLNVTRPQGITTGYKTFKHIHNKIKRPRDNKRYFNQTILTGRLDKETGVTNVRYKIDSKTKMVIEGAPVTFINVQLECNTALTPWCLKPEDQVELRRKLGLPMPKFK